MFVLCRFAHFDIFILLTFVDILTMFRPVVLIRIFLTTLWTFVSYWHYIGPLKLRNTYAVNAAYEIDDINHQRFTVVAPSWTIHITDITSDSAGIPTIHIDANSPFMKVIPNILNPFFI